MVLDIYIKVYKGLPLKMIINIIIQIGHYYTENFIDKLNKGDVMFRSGNFALHIVSKYMIQNSTGLNLISFINFIST